MYIITFFKDFLNCNLRLKGEFEWGVYTYYSDEDEEKAVEYAKELNSMPSVNIATEHFQVWKQEGTKLKRFVKNKSKLIYPSEKYPLFY